jgi:hypothetical protein
MHPANGQPTEHWHQARKWAKTNTKTKDIRKLLPPVLAALLQYVIPSTLRYFGFVLSEWRMTETLIILTTLFGGYGLLYGMEFAWNLFVRAPVALRAQEQKELLVLREKLDDKSKLPWLHFNLKSDPTAKTEIPMKFPRELTQFEGYNVSVSRIALLLLNVGERFCIVTAYSFSNKSGSGVTRKFSVDLPVPSGSQPTELDVTDALLGTVSGSTPVDFETIAGSYKVEVKIETNVQNEQARMQIGPKTYAIEIGRTKGVEFEVKIFC